MTRRYKKILIIVVLIIAILYLGLSLYVSHVMTSPLSRHIDISPEVISNNFEDVGFAASDGITLKGWFFKGSSDRLVIMVTGLLPNRVNTEYLGPVIMLELIREGYAVLAYDTRAHGQSAGNRVGYGSVEGRDVVGAVNFAKIRGFEGKNERSIPFSNKISLDSSGRQAI